MLLDTFLIRLIDWAIFLEVNTKVRGVLWLLKKAVGRPPKFNIKMMLKITDSISHNYSIVDSCAYAGVSRDTYYCHLKSEALFCEKIAAAFDNHTKVNFNFRTTHYLN